MSRVAVFGGAQCVKGEGVPAEVDLGQGFSFRARPNWVLDIAVRERGLASGGRELRILAGLTVNVGRLHRITGKE